MEPRRQRFNQRPARSTTRGWMSGLLLVAALVGVWAFLSQARELAGQEEVAEPTSESAATETAQPLRDDAPPSEESAGGLVPTLDIFEIMFKGGVLMWPILLCSVVTLVFVFERLITLRRGSVIPGPFVKRFFHQLREGKLSRDEAIELCRQNGSPIANTFAGALWKWGRPAVEVEQAVIDSGERAATGLRRYLRVFNGVSTVSPLLGLLGTVFGMIKAFNAVASSDALGRPQLLANGISEALLTTAFGLTVAIPALIAYWVFVSKADSLIVEMDALGQDLVQLISAEGGAEAAARAPRSRKREQPPAPNPT